MRRSAAIAHEAFSLLEVIIATAILAGSAMVLFSLIALGSRYGIRAEERTIAMAQAQSVLDEFIARMPNGDVPEEVIGILPSVPPRNFRVKVTPYELSNKTQARRELGASNELQTALYRVQVTLMVSTATIGREDVDPVCQVSRLVRRPQKALPVADGKQGVRGGS